MAGSIFESARACAPGNPRYARRMPRAASQAKRLRVTLAPPATIDVDDVVLVDSGRPDHPWIGRVLVASAPTLMVRWYMRPADCALRGPAALVRDWGPRELLWSTAEQEVARSLVLGTTAVAEVPPARRRGYRDERAGWWHAYALDVATGLCWVPLGAEVVEAPRPPPPPPPLGGEGVVEAPPPPTLSAETALRLLGQMLAQLYGLGPTPPSGPPPPPHPFEAFAGRWLRSMLAGRPWDARQCWTVLERRGALAFLPPGAVTRGPCALCARPEQLQWRLEPLDAAAQWAECPARYSSGCRALLVELAELHALLCPGAEGVEGRRRRLYYDAAAMRRHCCEVLAAWCRVAPRMQPDS